MKIRSKKPWRILILAAAILLPTTIQAIPVYHQFKLTVDRIDSCDPSPCFVDLGESYFGGFAVDDSLLATNSSNVQGLPESFFLPFEFVLWDTFSPFPQSDFVDYRGAQGLGTPWEFDVSNGAVVAMAGGVFGLGDVPYIDFFDNRFQVNLQELEGNGFFAGTYEILQRVPEPSTLMLAAIGVLMLSGFARFVKKT